MKFYSVRNFTTFAIVTAALLVWCDGLMPFGRPVAEIAAAVPGLVAAYNFDEGAGTVLTDVSGLGNHGVISGAVWTTTAKYSGALSFDGANDSVSIADASSLDLTNGLTLEAWVRPTSVTGWRTIVLKEVPGELAYALYASSNPARPSSWVRISGISYSAINSTQMTSNVWTHLAATYNGSVLRLYVNGQQAATRTVAGAIQQSNNPLRIGGNTIWGEYFRGQLDDVRIYNRALTATEIQADMNTPVASQPDTTPPSVAITAPADGTTVSNVVTVSASASDNVGVAGVQFLLNDVDLGPEDLVAPYVLNWDTRNYTNGAYRISARARDGAGNVTTAAEVDVTVNNAAPAPDFTFTVTPSSLTAPPSGSVSYQVDVTFVNGFSSTSTDLWVTGLPQGATGVFAFDPMPHQGRTALTITTNAVAPGTYQFVAGATSEGIVHSQNLTLVVSAAADFTLSASPSIQNVVRGNATTYQVSVAVTNGFNQTVTLSAAGLPAQTTAVFSPNPLVPPATTVLTVDTAPTTPPGQYTIVVSGQGGGLTRTVSLTLIVTSVSGTWSVDSLGSTGVTNNSVRVGGIRTDGLNRVYVGTISTGRMLEYSWTGSAWSGPVDVGGSPTGREIHNFNIGAARSDGRARIYAASTDRNVYEIWHTTSGWQQMTVGTLDDQAMHTAVGDGRGDGVSRLYAVSLQSAYEFTWTGSAWTGIRIGSAPGAHGISVGPGRGPGQMSLFIASISSGTFEGRYGGGTWSITGMGDSGDVRDVDWGVGRNDGVVRVYSALFDGRIRELTWNGTSWTFAHLPALGAQAVHAYVLPGRNDGVNRVYSSSGNGKVYEHSWNGSSWSLFNMGGGPDYMYGLHFGAGRNDGLMRLYSADRGTVNSVYEFSWTGPPPTDTTPPSAPGGLTAIGRIGQAQLSWTAASDNVGVAIYDVHRSASSGIVPTAGNRVGQTTTTSFTDNAPAGTYFYVVTAADAAGNISQPSGEVSATILADTTAPQVSLTAPTSGATLSGVAALSANASDDVAVAGVQFLLNGGNLGTEDAQPAYSLSWDTRAVPNGTYTLSARARDAAGNTATSSPVTVSVSNGSSSGLVAAYAFNEGTGTTVGDSSGRSNAGTVNNAVWTPAGVFGSALSFNGTNAWVTIADSASLDLTTGMTLEAWVRPSSVTASWRTVILKERPGGLAYALYATDGSSRPPAGYVAIGGSDVGVVGPAVLAINTWTHLAMTYDGTVLRLFVNGQLANSRTVAGAGVVSASPLRIGGNASWGEWFSGLIDEVRVYNRALSQAEIQADMNLPVGQ